MQRRSSLQAGVALAGMLALPGCALIPDAHHRGPAAPRWRPWPWSTGQGPRLALVLSSGGPRGFVHAGVLRALDELNVRPDLIIGASVGALVGSLFAGGMNGRALEELAMSIGPLSLVSLAPGGAETFSGAPIADKVNELLDGRRLEGLPIPFAAAAVRRADQSLVAFNAGDTGVAVQASCAIPGRFSPVRIEGEYFVDPDAVSPMPVRLARAMGARHVIAVDASAHEDRAPASAQRYRQADLIKRSLIRLDAKEADLVLHPYFGYWVSLGQDFRRRSIEAGYRDTLAQGDRIRLLRG